MRWTDSLDRLTGCVAGWVERNRGKGEGEGEGEGADGHVTENRRVHGFASEARRGAARERGSGRFNCTHVIVMWLIHNVVNEY